MIFQLAVISKLAKLFTAGLLLTLGALAAMVSEEPAGEQILARPDATFYVALIAAVFAGLSGLLNTWNSRQVSRQVGLLDTKTDDVVKTTVATSDKLDVLATSSADTATETAGKLVELHSQGNSNWDKAMMALAKANEEIAALRGIVSNLQAVSGNPNDSQTTAVDAAQAHIATEAAAVALQAAKEAKEAAAALIVVARETAEELKDTAVVTKEVKECP